VSAELKPKATIKARDIAMVLTVAFTQYRILDADLSEVQVLDRALIVKQPYADLILSGQKALEMRSRHTKIRGRVGIIPKGTGVIKGSVEIIDSWDYSDEPRLKSIGGQSLHQVEPKDWHLLDKWCFAWELSKPIIFGQPVPYDHPKGAVIWVKLKLCRLRV
jgi:hypothetical protein